MDQTAALSEKTADLRSVHTSNLPELFDQLQISLIVSTYQAGKAIVVRGDNGRLNTHFRMFSKPMGIVADPTRLTIGGANTVWEYRNMPALAKKLEPAGKHDACYLPRRIHVTGDIDIHELARDGDNEPLIPQTASESAKIVAPLSLNLERLVIAFGEQVGVRPPPLE